MPYIQCRTEFSYIPRPSATYGVDYGPPAPPNRQPYRKIPETCPNPLAQRYSTLLSGIAMETDTVEWLHVTEDDNPVLPAAQIDVFKQIRCTMANHRHGNPNNSTMRKNRETQTARRVSLRIPQPPRKQFNVDCGIHAYTCTGINTSTCIRYLTLSWTHCMLFNINPPPGFCYCGILVESWAI